MGANTSMKTKVMVRLGLCIQCVFLIFWLFRAPEISGELKVMQNELQKGDANLPTLTIRYANSTETTIAYDPSKSSGQPRHAADGSQPFRSGTNRILKKAAALHKDRIPLGSKPAKSELVRAGLTALPGSPMPSVGNTDPRFRNLQATTLLIGRLP